MTAASAVDLASEVADAHGSASLDAADHLAVSFCSRGLAFKLKRQRDALPHVEARLSPVRQQIILTGETPSTWTVNVTKSDELNSRLAALRSGSRRFRWQPEDLGAFAAAAITSPCHSCSIAPTESTAHLTPEPSDDSGSPRHERSPATAPFRHCTSARTG